MRARRGTSTLPRAPRRRRPHRIRMAHNLLLSYGLYRKMEIYVRAAPRSRACLAPARAGRAP